MKKEKEKEDSFEELQKRKKRKLQSNEERERALNNQAKSTHQKGRKKTKEKKSEQRAKRFGLVLVVLQAILSVVFLGILFQLNLLPLKFNLLVVVALVFLLLELECY